MKTQRGGSEQLKTPGLGKKSGLHRGSRGSRGGGRSDEPEASGASAQTPFWGRREDFSGGLGGGDGGMAAGDGATSRSQIPKSGICDDSIGAGDDDERAASHKHATTSWRCGFEWVSSVLESRLRAWDEDVIDERKCSLDDIYRIPFFYHRVTVAHHAVPHIIGRGGRVIREVEKVCGVFLNLCDLPDGFHEVCITGPRPACIVASFAIELLSTGQHSALTTLQSLLL